MKYEMLISKNCKKHYGDDPLNLLTYGREIATSIEFAECCERQCPFYDHYNTPQCKKIIEQTT